MSPFPLLETMQFYISLEQENVTEMTPHDSQGWDIENNTAPTQLSQLSPDPCSWNLAPDCE